MALNIREIVEDFATCIRLADSRAPIALNARSKAAFHPGIGPHSESQTVKLVMNELTRYRPQEYQDRAFTSVSYPDFPRQKCDLCIGMPASWQWAIEIKMLRFLGDNGKLNDNILMHIFSPYPAHRSALTDCSKLAASQIAESKAILIYGFDDNQWPLEPAIDAFEILARANVVLGERFSARFSNLIHPIHKSGGVFGWQIHGTR